MLAGMDNSGRTPLLIAASLGNDEAITSLLARGAQLDAATSGAMLCSLTANPP
jgi:ankyrin repeat protein